MKILWNAYFAYIKDPTLAVRQFVQQRCFSVAFAGYGVAALCWVCFFWLGKDLTAWGFLWRFVFFWLLEVSMGYLWAALSGLFLNFFSDDNGPSALFIALGLSGFVQSLLLCFALVAQAAQWMFPLTTLIGAFVLILRFSFAVLNTARAVQVGLSKALGALCFVLVPVTAAVFLGIGFIALLISFVA